MTDYTELETLARQIAVSTKLAIDDGMGSIYMQQTYAKLREEFDDETLNKLMKMVNAKLDRMGVPKRKE